MKKQEFRIVSKPSYIALTCPYCHCHIEIPWKNIEVPYYWGDDWSELQCPDCNSEITLGEWQYD